MTKSDREIYALANSAMLHFGRGLRDVNDAIRKIQNKQMSQEQQQGVLWSLHGFVEARRDIQFMVEKYRQMINAKAVQRYE